MKVIAFDLGGTLMEYQGMPYSWVDYYSTGFHALNDKYYCNVSEELLNESVEILKSYNPRINYREIEYSAEQIFTEVLKKWDIESPIEEMIYSFFDGLQLKAVVYEETIPTLVELKKHGYKIAALTDLPTAMPDDLFKKDIRKDCLFWYDENECVELYCSVESSGVQISGLKKTDCFPT